MWKLILGLFMLSLPFAAVTGLAYGVGGIAGAIGLWGGIILVVSCIGIGVRLTEDWRDEQQAKRLSRDRRDEDELFR